MRLEVLDDAARFSSQLRKNEGPKDDGSNKTYPSRARFNADLQCQVAHFWLGLGQHRRTCQLAVCCYDSSVCYDILARKNQKHRVCRELIKRMCEVPLSEA